MAISSFLGSMFNMTYRVGFSKDIHRLKEGRKLILAGVVIPHDFGEEAHSDGDVVYHAVSESILGALALGDLGYHFPDTDDKTLDLDSSVIMKYVYNLMKEKGYRINNIDVFISLETPKLASYLNLMRKNIADLLNCSIDAISVKAGTNEKVGPVGRKEAVEAYAYTMLVKED